MKPLSRLSKAPYIAPKSLVAMTCSLSAFTLGPLALLALSPLPVQAQSLTVEESRGETIISSSGFGFDAVKQADVLFSGSFLSHRTVQMGGGVSFGPDYQATILGSGDATFGRLGGSVSAYSRGIANGGVGYSKAFGLIQARFDDLGIVRSSTLAIGTPVTVPFPCFVESVAVFTGAPLQNYGAGLYNGLNASYIVNITDETTGVRRFAQMVDNQATVLMLNTAIGNQISFSANLYVSMQTVAGGVSNRTEVQGTMDASHTALFQLDAPEGVTLETSSGQDYRVSAATAPEPSALALFLPATLCLVIQQRKSKK